MVQVALVSTMSISLLEVSPERGTVDMLFNAGLADSEAGWATDGPFIPSCLSVSATSPGARWNSQPFDGILLQRTKVSRPTSSRPHRVNHPWYIESTGPAFYFIGCARERSGVVCRGDVSLVTAGADQEIWNFR